MYILRVLSLMYHVKHDICKVFFLKVSHMLCFDHILALSYSSNDIFQCLWTLRGDSAGRKEEIDAVLSPASSPDNWPPVGMPPVLLLHADLTVPAHTITSRIPAPAAGRFSLPLPSAVRQGFFVFPLTVDLFHLKVFMTPSIEVYKMGIEIKHSPLLLGILAI